MSGQVNDCLACPTCPTYDPVAPQGRWLRAGLGLRAAGCRQRGQVGRVRRAAKRTPRSGGQADARPPKDGRAEGASEGGSRRGSRLHEPNRLVLNPLPPLAAPGK